VWGGTSYAGKVRGVDIEPSRPTTRQPGRLPHISKKGCTYFVTFCLADAVPDRLKRKRKIENADDPSMVAKHYDMAPSVGSRILEQVEVASIVEGALLHFQGDRYALSAWCVMPNHVHAVVTPHAEYSLPQILHSWKSYSSHEINKLLKKQGSVWEKESFDHLVRHENAFRQFVDYTEKNPVTAGL
jgi:REP element-mobilizing transposase RayT